MSSSGCGTHARPGRPGVLSGWALRADAPQEAAPCSRDRRLSSTGRLRGRSSRKNKLRSWSIDFWGRQRQLRHSVRPEWGRAAPQPRPVRLPAHRTRSVQKVRSRRPCASGGALSPGPNGLDRWNHSTHGILRRWRGRRRPTLASRRARSTRECRPSVQFALSRGPVITG